MSVDDIFVLILDILVDHLSRPQRVGISLEKSDKNRDGLKCDLPEKTAV